MPGALDGLRVVDMATVIAGPGAARHLADFGADVIKVEPPALDSIRRMGWTPPEGGDSYFWRIAGRGKRCITLDLASPDDLAVARALLRDAHVMVENMRPGKLERLGLDPVDLLAANPRLVVVRVTGFGPRGPYAQRPGFASTAEAMSGFAALLGEEGSAPLLPPVALTDEITALAGAFAAMVAVRHAERTGRGQIVDVNLLESMLQVLGPLPSACAHLDYEQPRMGSRLPYTVPRGTYRCADGRWMAVSASTDSVAARFVEMLGLGGGRFATFADRVAHCDELDEAMGRWAAARTRDEALAECARMDAAAAPVATMREVLADPHVREVGALVEVDGVRMQAPIARLSVTPGEIRGQGPAPDAHGAEIRRAVARGAWPPREA